MNPMIEFFGDEIKRAREVAGMTQDELAKELHCSRSQVAMYETGRRIPDEDTVDKLDAALRINGLLGRMRDRLVVAEANPSWFVPWLHYEQEATEIRWYEPLLVPGLLQTEGYARALLVDDDRVAARLARQDVLNRASVTTIIEEEVLRRRRGGPEVMAEQLHALTSSPAVVQILPITAETRRSHDGSFALAVVDGVDVAYVDTPARGFVLADEGVASTLRRRWEELSAEALPRTLSRETILKEADRWKNES